MIGHSDTYTAACKGIVEALLTMLDGGLAASEAIAAQRLMFDVMSELERDRMSMKAMVEHRRRLDEWKEANPLEAAELAKRGPFGPYGPAF